MVSHDFKLGFLVILLSFVIYVECQENESSTDLPENDVEITTVEPVTTTTTLAPLRELDFTMSPFGNFQVDINFNEIRGKSDTVEMSVKLEAPENTEPSRYLCQGLLGIYLLELPNCDGLDITVPQPARKLATINKRVGQQALNLTDLSIPTLSTYNCLIVAAENSSHSLIFTTTATTTTTTTTTTSSLETTALSSSQDVEILESSRQLQVRKKRQKNDDLNDLQSESGDEGGPIGTDYYDPEDITDDENLREEEQEKDPDIANDLAPGNPGILDDEEVDLKFGLDKRTLALFRRDGCPSGKTFNRIPLLVKQPKALTRSFFGTSFAIVVSSGSVGSGSTSVVSSSSPGVIYFGSAGSFNFNPLSNWPLVVLQGSYVTATYGIIIIWALVLGAIVWSVGINHVSGLFTAKRVGHVESEMIYRPLERLTNLIHYSLDRYSAMNRRIQRPKLPQKPLLHHYRTNLNDYIENDEEDYEDSKFDNYENS